MSNFCLFFNPCSSLPVSMFYPAFFSISPILHSFSKYLVTFPKFLSQMLIDFTPFSLRNGRVLFMIVIFLSKALHPIYILLRHLGFYSLLFLIYISKRFNKLFIKYLLNKWLRFISLRI